MNTIAEIHKLCKQVNFTRLLPGRDTEYREKNLQAFLNSYRCCILFIIRKEKSILRKHLNIIENVS